MGRRFESGREFSSKARRGLRVRWIIPIAIGLFGVGWLLSVADFAGPKSTHPTVESGQITDDWRRTSRGWENSTEWLPPVFVRRPPFHPALLAAFQVWAACAALTMAPRETLRHSVASTRGPVRNATASS
jgi:hypothetical protein